MKPLDSTVSLTERSALQRYMVVLWEHEECSGYSHSGDVFTGEGIGGVTNQQTGLTHSPEEVTAEDP